MTEQIEQPMSELTRILEAVDADPEAVGQQMTKWLKDVRQVAAYHMRRERADHTLQETALVNEIYLKMAAAGGTYRSREHFLATAAAFMRQVLIDYARTKKRKKRNAGSKPVSLDVVSVADLAARADPDAILTLDEAMETLAARDAELGTIVRLKFYAGLTSKEVADALATSQETVKRRWAYAKAVLYAMLEKDFKPAVPSEPACEARQD